VSGPDEPADRVALPGAAAAAIDVHRPEVAAQHSHRLRTGTHRREVDFERARAIERSQRADAVADAREENREVGTLDEALFVLELRGREEIDADRTGRRGSRRQIDRDDFA